MEFFTSYFCSISGKSGSIHLVTKANALKHFWLLIVPFTPHRQSSSGSSQSDHTIRTQDQTPSPQWHHTLADPSHHPLSPGLQPLPVLLPGLPSSAQHRSWHDPVKWKSAPFGLSALLCLPKYSLQTLGLAIEIHIADSSNLGESHFDREAVPNPTRSRSILATAAGAPLVLTAFLLSMTLITCCYTTDFIWVSVFPTALDARWQQTSFICSLLFSHALNHAQGRVDAHHPSFK